MQKTDGTSSASTGNGSTGKDGWDPEAPWGRKLDGTPRKKTGPTPKPTASGVAEYNITTNQGRICECCDIMRALRWERGRTIKQLAKKWGVSFDYAKNLSSYASRIVREELLDANAVGATIGEALLQIVKEGMGSKKYEHRKMVILAAKLLSELSPGLRAEQNINVVASRGADLPDDPDQLRRIATKLLNSSAREGQQLILERGDK